MHTPVMGGLRMTTTILLLSDPLLPLLHLFRYPMMSHSSAHTCLMHTAQTCQLPFFRTSLLPDLGKDHRVSITHMYLLCPEPISSYHSFLILLLHRYPRVRHLCGLHPMLCLCLIHITPFILGTLRRIYFCHCSCSRTC